MLAPGRMTTLSCPACGALASELDVRCRGCAATLPWESTDSAGGAGLTVAEPPRSTRPGEIVGGRFEIEWLAGEGAMGEVYRARDLSSGSPVALKLLRSTTGARRFVREAAALEAVDHPAVARYLACSERGAPTRWLAMEWIDGEPLSELLRRRKLDPDEALALGLRVADALGAVHRRGVIHRDVKPSNLFLPGGDITRVKLIDFGVARHGARVTATGLILGTPAYMAPEQARGHRDIGPAADVFSLGCVMFRCLAGRSVHSGGDALAVLLKMVMDEAPRLREIDDTIPAALDDLVARMLSRAAENRPPHGDAAAAEIAAIMGQGRLRRSRPAPRELTATERRVMCLVVSRAPRIPMDPGALAALAEQHLGKLEMLADRRSVAIVLAGDGTGAATDLAAQAARCALALRAALGPGPSAVVTVRGVLSVRLPLGEGIDRAVALLDAGADAIQLDELTAGLLGLRFEVVAGDQGFSLIGERVMAGGSVGTLLGRPTPCVGRERELSMLEACFAECAADGAAQAVVVVAAAGAGKSRLARELAARVRRRFPDAEIWGGEGNSLRAGSAFDLLGQVIRSACCIQAGEPIEARRQKITARVARHVAPADQGRMAELLGEIAGAPFPDEGSASLRAARNDALLMGDQLRRAWEDFLAAVCEETPVLIVLDDLHWGDLPTVRFLDGALLRVKDEPWMVLALGRPEVQGRFPSLWDKRHVLDIRLKALGKRASELLVRQVLGEDVPAATVERLAAQADGNAFYLEELIRAVAEDAGKALPETVLAMVEARLGALDPQTRRVLRAASVFGEVVWRGGLAALLGADLDREAIEALVERELMVRSPSSRFAGEEELAFRHGLLRDGAYAMLTEEDRALGHRLAAEWLEQKGEADPLVLAEHWERAGAASRAGSYYLRAAEQAHRGGDADTAVVRARRGLACGVPDAERAALAGLLAEAHGWRSEWEAASGFMDDALRLSPPGSAPWARAVAARLARALDLRKNDEFLEMLGQIVATEPAPDAAGQLAFALSLATLGLMNAGRLDRVAPVIARLHAIVEPIRDRDPVARAWMHLAHPRWEAWVQEDPWAGLVRAEAGKASFEEASHRRGVFVAQVFIGVSAWTLGAFGRARAALGASGMPDEELSHLSSLRRHTLVGVLADQGALGEARDEALAMLASGREGRFLPPYEGRARWALGEVLFRLGDLDAADVEVRAAIDALAVAPLDRVAATATLAALDLARGRAADALAGANEVIAFYEGVGAFGFKGALARRVQAEALHAQGDHAAAVAAITALEDRLLAQAGRIHDPALRASFVGGVPENARAFELAARWRGGG
jgi:eukaryotic-like serine/threonine-protein kinase